jgi:hypothetical protein
MLKAPRGELGGLENAKRFRSYVDSLRAEGRGLPARNGGPNLSAIAKACGFDRGVFYANEEAKLLLDEAWVELGLADGRVEPSTAYEAARLKEESKSRGDSRSNSLEQEVLRLRAENAQLKVEIARFKAIQMLMAETGRMP